MNQTPVESGAEYRRIARTLVEARRLVRALARFPGDLPVDASSAYECQELAIGLWPDGIAGWKVGWVGPEWRPPFTHERLVGPIFDGHLQFANQGEALEVGIFQNGFAAVEAEFVFRIGADAAPGRVDWTADSAAGVVAALHVGIEVASSPIATINELGPTAIIADFGNNAGLLVGAQIPRWRSNLGPQLRSATDVNGVPVGTGSADSVSGGPLSALAFALNQCASRGRPLRTGQWVCTGATTGIHVVREGDEVEVRFEQAGTLRCRVTGVKPC